LSGDSCRNLHRVHVAAAAIVRFAELRNHPLIVFTQADEVATSVPIRALQKALELVGGRKTLAERLGVKAADIETWTAGKEAIPREIFLRVVDLLIDEITPAGGCSESSEPPSSRSSAPFSPRDRD
jgi:Putative antitoxin of bacterial toxin-antitoxin system, YdaS/YdaT